jgi:CTP synthase (UTP-ammonia lyase)
MAAIAAPALGTCGGFQYMALEYARNTAGLSGAAHAKTDPGGVLHPLAGALLKAAGQPAAAS